MTSSSTTLPASHQMRADRQVVLVLSFFAFAVLGMLDGITGVAFALMRVDFGVGLDAMAWILLPSTLGFIISSFFVGRVLTRLSMATVVIGAGLLRSLALLSMGVAPAWWMISATSLLLGLSGGFIDAGMNTWFATRFSPRLMNWLHACFGIGATFSPIILTLLLSAGFSWRSGYLFMMVVQLLVVAVTVATRGRWHVEPLPLAELEGDSSHGAQGTRSQAEPAHANVRDTLRLPAVWLGIAVFLCYTGVELTTANWSYTIFTESRGVAARTAGIWVSLFWGSFALGRIVFGFFQVKSIANLLRVVMLTALGGTLLFAAAPVGWVAMVGAVVIGFSVAPIFPMLVSETPARLGRAHAQHAIGFQVGAAGIGVALLPSIAGALAEATSPAAIPWFLLAVTVVLILLHEALVRMHAPPA